METYTSLVFYAVACAVKRSVCVPRKEEEAPKQDPMPRSDDKFQKNTGCKCGAWVSLMIASLSKKVVILKGEFPSGLIESTRITEE